MKSSVLTSAVHNAYKYVAWNCPMEVVAFEKHVNESLQNTDFQSKLTSLPSVLTENQHDCQVSFAILNLKYLGQGAFNQILPSV